MKIQDLCSALRDARDGRDKEGQSGVHAELVLWPLVAIGSAGALVQLSVRVIGAHLGGRWAESGEQSVGGL